MKLRTVRLEAVDSFFELLRERKGIEEEGLYAMAYYDRLDREARRAAIERAA